MAKHQNIHILRAYMIALRLICGYSIAFSKSIILNQRKLFS
jgi:hypothetical protein